MIRLAIYLLIVVGIGIFYLLLDMKKVSLDNEKNDILVQTGSLSDQLLTLKNKAAEIAEATKIWQQIPERNKKMSGLKLDDVKNKLADAAKIYQINDLVIDLSTPVELPDPYKTKSAVTLSSDVTLKFGSINDENILIFVDSVLKEIPGYVTVKSFKMLKQGEISDEMLDNIRKGLKPSIVTGELSFQWRDLKLVPTEKTDKVEKAKVK